MKKFFLFSLLLAGFVANAQASSHEVDLTWTASPDGAL